ncbi:MAG: WD40 repeat domain-containing serine/threonine protein kinase [Fuerstiella sp.]
MDQLNADQQIDDLCDAFEQEWLAGQEPDIQEWLEQADETLRPRLLTELVKVDLEYRLKQGVSELSLADYFDQYDVNPADISLCRAARGSRTPDTDVAAAADTISDVNRKRGTGRCAPDAREGRDANSHVAGAPYTGVPSDVAELDENTKTNLQDEGLLPFGRSGLHRARFGDYEVVRELGRGGMGVVYLARHLTLGREVALKTLPAIAVTDVEAQTRFRSEAEAAARLDHRGIVPVFEIGEEAGVPWFAMGYVSGPTLGRRIKEEVLSGRPAAEIAQQIADALEYAHSKGVIHRDIKPSNVLIDDAGRVRITDFGLAKLATRDQTLTETGQVLGTAAYMPPEQASGRQSKATAASADVYSTGALLYCCITGRPPFQASTAVEVLRQVEDLEPVPPKRLNPEVDEDLNTICLKCLQKDPARRFASAGELSAELGRYLRKEPILSRPVSRMHRFLRWCQRRPFVAAAGMLAAMLIVVLTVGVPFALLERSERQQAQELAAANAARAATQQYYATVQNVREQRFVREAGWTWEALDAIKEAAALPADGKNLTDLRSLTANVLMTPDLRSIQTFAEGVDPAAVASSDDGRFVALAEVREANDCGKCFVYVYELQGADTELPRMELYRKYSIELEDHTFRAILGDLGLAPRVKPDGFRSVCFSHDGTRIAAGTRHGDVLEWKLEDPDESPAVLKLQTNEYTVRNLAYSIDDQHFFLMTEDNFRLQVWDRATAQQNWSSEATVYSFAPHMETDNDGAVYISDKELGPLVVRSARQPVEEKLPWSIPSDRFPGRFGVSDAGELMVSGVGAAETIETSISDVATGETTIRITKSGTATTWFTTHHFGPMKTSILATSDPGELCLVDALSGSTESKFVLSGVDQPQMTILPNLALAIGSSHSETQLVEQRRWSGLTETGSRFGHAVRAFAPGAFAISAFDISPDGRRVALYEGTSGDRTKMVCRIRSFDVEGGAETGRWTLRSFCSDSGLRSAAKGAYVVCDRENVEAAIEFCSHQFSLTSHGFLPVEGLQIPFATADAIHISDRGATFAFPPDVTDWRGFAVAQPCVTLKLNDTFPQADESLTVEVHSGDRLLKQIDIEPSTFGSESPGWLLLQTEYLPATDVLDDGLTIRLTFDSDRPVLQDGSHDGRIELGPALLLPSRGDGERGYFLGPLDVQGNGCLIGIDDEEVLKKWPDGSAEPTFEWSDILNDRTSIREVASADDFTILGTRKGHVYKLDGGNNITQLNRGPDKGPVGDTGDDIQCLAITRSGDFAAAGNLNGEVLLFDLTKSENFEVQRKELHRHRLTSVALTSDASLIATSGLGNKVKVWQRNGADLELLFELDQLRNPVIQMEFTPDDKQLFMLCEGERGLRIIDLPALRRVYDDYGINW